MFRCTGIFTRSPSPPRFQRRRSLWAIPLHNVSAQMVRGDPVSEQGAFNKEQEPAAKGAVAHGFGFLEPEIERRYFEVTEELVL